MIEANILEKHTYALAILNKLGINLLDYKSIDEALKTIREEIQFNEKGVYIPQLDFYYSDYDEAIENLLQLALEEFKYFKNERLVAAIFSGKLEFKRKPHIENLMNGYILPCSKEQAEAIKNLHLDLA